MAPRHCDHIQTVQGGKGIKIGASYHALGQDEAVAACEQALGYKLDFELARNNLQR